MNRKWMTRIGVSLLVLAGLAVVAGVAFRAGQHHDDVRGTPSSVTMASARWSSPTVGDTAGPASASGSGSSSSRCSSSA